MTARDVLAEIGQRAELARTPLSGPDAWRVRESALDVPRLVAALRAVLDPKLARRVAGCEVYEESCDCGGSEYVCRHGKYLYCDQHGDPADQCTAFINAQVLLNSTITEALGGGA